MVLTFPSVRKLSKSSSVITLLTTGIGRAVAAAILIFTCLRCLATVKFIAFWELQRQVRHICLANFPISLMWSEMGADRDSPLFSRKIVEIEGFSLRASMLDECQIYSLASNSLPRYRVNRRWPAVGRFQDGELVFLPLKTPAGEATLTGERSILTILRKMGVPPQPARSIYLSQKMVSFQILIARILHQISALVIFKQGKVKEAFEESTTHKLSVRISHKVRLSVIL